MDQLKRFALSSPALLLPRPRRSPCSPQTRSARGPLSPSRPEPQRTAAADGLASVFAVAGDRPGRLEIASRITGTASAAADYALAAAPNRRRTRTQQQQQQQ